MPTASNPVIVSPQIASCNAPAWAVGKGDQLVAGMDVPAASGSASGASGEEVVITEEVPEEVLSPEEIPDGIVPEGLTGEAQDDPQEIHRPKIAPDPGQPTRQQLAEHRITHWPFRSWCKWCVMGRARGTPHAPSGGSAIAIIGLDYFFITRAGVKKVSELDFWQRKRAVQSLRFPERPVRSSSALS